MHHTNANSFLSVMRILTKSIGSIAEEFSVVLQNLRIIVNNLLHQNSSRNEKQKQKLEMTLFFPHFHKTERNNNNNNNDDGKTRQEKRNDNSMLLGCAR